MRKVSKNFIKVFTLVFILLCIFSPAVSAENINTKATSPKVDRIGGTTRILTSVEISKKAYKDNGAEAVILVGSKGEIDALGGTILASKLDAPIIMTDKDSLTSATKKEIERLKPEKIIILGGESVVSKKVERDLSQYNVERIGGKNREETAIKIAKEAVGEKIDEVFLGLGYDVFADAVAIGPVTAKLNKPLFLSKKSGISDQTIEAIQKMGVNKVTIIGGKSVIPLSTENKLEAMGITVDRVCGNNREETSIEIAETYIENPSEIIVASGYIFPDSLVGGYYAHKINAPIILTKKNELKTNTFNYIAKTKKDVTILGLHGAVDETVESNLKRALKDEEDITKDEEYITEDQKWGRIEEGTLGSHGGIVNSYDGYLGYGYNMITAAYYNQKDINSAHPVVDMNSLAGEDKVYIDYNTNFADPKTYIFSSLKEYSGELSAKANVEGNFPLAGSIKANFGIDTSYQMTNNQKLATLQANLETQKDYIMENSPELLAKHVARGFKTSVDKLSQNATDKTIKDFITKYGTHVLTNVTMGGRFDLNYLYTNKSGSESSDISASLQASYRYVKGSTDTNVKTAKKEIEESSNIKITTFGGSVTVDPVSIESAMASYSDWSNQVQDGKVTLVDASEVIPIWEIVEAMDENYKNLSSAIENYCEKEGINTIGMFKDTKGLPVPPKTYISDIYIGYGDSSAEAKGMLRNNGVLDANIVNLDLNKEAGGRWIYLGYKKTTSKNKAITHILADYWNSSRTKNIISNGFEMQIIPTDLNRGALGKHIYLYYTRNPGAGQPLTEIIYQHKNKIQGGSADGYNGLRCYTTGQLMDLNMGTEKGDLIYLWFKRN